MRTNLLFVLFLSVCLNFSSNAIVPERKGWWKFDDPTNLVKAEIGSPLLAVGIPIAVDGPSVENKAIQIGLGNYLELTHGITANGGGTMVNEYSLQIDFSIPEANKWHAFFQTELENTGDADLFANSASNAIGTAATGYSAKAVSANTWYRMIVTVKNGEFFKIYVDGVLWLTSAGQAIDDRFALANMLLLFADNDGDDGTINCSEAGIWSTALTEEEVAELGGPLGVRVPVRTKLGSWKFDDPNDLLKADIGNPLELVGTQTAVAGPTAENGATQIGLGSFLKMNHNLQPIIEGNKINEYSIQFDFSVPEISKWHAFYQTTVANNDDADLFTNKTSNAIGTAATTYSSNAISANTWYRMVLTVKNGEFFRIYLDGELWLDAPGQEINGRFSLGDALLLFADDDGDDAAINCSEINLWEVALTENEVLELGTSPNEKLPERIGWWKFEDSVNLYKAEIGSDLIPTGSITAAQGPVAGNNAVEVGLGSFLTMKHGSYGNGYGFMVNDYTLQIDFSIPATETWHAFFQTDIENVGDADLFTNKTNAIGTAQTSYTSNTIQGNTWYRMVLTVRNGEYFRMYINGELWLDVAGQSVDGRFALGEKLLLFADDDGDDGTIYCSEVGFWDLPLTADQVALLGDAKTLSTNIQDLNTTGTSISLGQNFPNPFSKSTNFPYQIQKSGNVSFHIFDISGKEVRTINEGQKASGSYNLILNSEKLKNGIYFLKMKTNDFTVTQKMVIAQ
ncbi:MAG: LamG-like jellyroll fold domain-containing protein [Prolixibacteraceae bacterium]